MMKTSLFTSIALALTPLLSFAGSATQKAPPPPAPAAPLFHENELQLDLFGVYGVGHAPDHAGPFREHAWGGGLGLNYFWSQNLGVGLDFDAKRAQETPLNGFTHKTIEQYTASLIYRFPLEEYALAPYGFLGGGVTSNVGNLGSAHAGIGVEYRILPAQLGLFADTRWTYYGDRAGRGDQNNFQIRSGVRFLF